MKSRIILSPLVSHRINSAWICFCHTSSTHFSSSCFSFSEGESAVYYRAPIQKTVLSHNPCSKLIFTFTVNTFKHLHYLLLTMRLPQRRVRAMRSSLHILNHFPSTSRKVSPGRIYIHHISIRSKQATCAPPAARGLCLPYLHQHLIVCMLLWDSASTWTWCACKCELIWGADFICVGGDLLHSLLLSLFKCEVIK